MSWVTPRAALQMIGKRKLAALTNEANQQELIGLGDGVTLVFVTPFVFGTDVKVFEDVAVAYTAQVDPTKGERVVVTLATAPAVGVQVMASSADAVNADNLDAAFLRAQADIRGMVDAALYETPADDATNVPALLVGWAAVIAWYYLAGDPRRPGLLKAYPELVDRYIDVFSGIDSTLKRVAKGTFSLRGVLTYRGSLPPFEAPTPDISTQSVEFSSAPRVYGGGRGVF
jgi:phage gp36-like protein